MNHQVLVVDNEPFVVEELIEFLMGHGYDCIGAASPGEALAQFQRNPEVDIVLSDFRMQEMNGVQLVATLQAIDPDRLFESAIFTGDAERDDVIAALRVGVADYFQKPLDLEQLLASLEKIQLKLEQRNAKSQMQHLNQDFRQLLDSFNKLYDDMDASQGAARSAKAARTARAARTGKQASASTHPMPQEVEKALAEKLSPRQHEVARLIARGLTNYQIACELGISENTVKIYVSQVLRIFNLSNRTQLALTLEAEADARKHARKDARKNAGKESSADKAAI